MSVVALVANRLRAALTTLGVIIGVTTVVSIAAVIEGLDRTFAQQIEAVGSGVLYVQKFSWTAHGDWWSMMNRRDLGWEEYEAVQRHASKIQGVAPFYSTGKTVARNSESLEGVAITGTNEDHRVVFGSDPEIGRFLMHGDVHYRKANCVIGAEIAEQLFGEEAILGERIKIDRQHYRVVGVLPERGEVLGFNLDTQVFIPIGSFMRQFGGRRSLELAVKAPDPGQIDEVRDELTGILRRVRHVSPGEASDFAINEQSMLTDLYRSLTGALYATASIVGGLSLVVGGIGIMNIMMVAVTERVKEIGIRKAVGARAQDILAQFLMESVLVSLVGGGLGVALGYGVTHAIGAAAPFEPVISLGAIGVGLGFSSAVGVVFGVYPAARAARLDPVVALGQGSV